MPNKVLVIYTGGTLGMVKGPKGYEPKKGFLQKLLAEKIPELKSKELPKFEVLEYDPLLDSSNMTPYDWLKIAKDIYNNYNEFSGFVVLHGTDTMAYTASGVSFLLKGLDKPVVFTGSQIPLVETRNDARDNLVASFLLAQEKRLKEVVICFGNKLLRGVRATKVNADSFEAFDSPNFPRLGEVGIEIKVNWELIGKRRQEKFSLRVEKVNLPKLIVLPLFPGFSGEMLKDIVLSQKPEIVILETFGSGNVPHENIDFREALEVGKQKNILFFNRTQCLKGKVRPKVYAAGSILEELGVIPSLDMTREALISKLICLYSLNPKRNFIEEKLRENWCGELS